MIKGEKKEKKKKKRKEKIEIKKNKRKENYVKFQQFSFYTFIPTSRKYWVFCNTLPIVRFFYSFFMYHIFYRMKHSSAILNTHFGLSKIRFFANILEIDPIRYLHRLPKTVCKNWIEHFDMEYRFEWVFFFSSTSFYDLRSRDETAKRVMEESTVSHINIWILFYLRLILLYRLSHIENIGLFCKFFLNISSYDFSFFSYKVCNFCFVISSSSFRYENF